MKQQSLKILLLVATVIFSSAVCHAMTIVNDGQPTAGIVVAADASSTVQDAAKELQHYIEKSTGATLPIHHIAGAGTSIVLQNAAALPDSPKLDPEGFILEGVNNKTYVIAGGGDRGIAFGVDEFLERYLGVRWLMPGEMGEDVPNHSTLDIPVTKVQQEPVYLSRRLGNITDSTSDVDGMWAWHNRAVWRESHGHNLLNIFPLKDYAQTHPEFYPTFHGKPVVPKPGTWNWQPNFSAPGIVDEGVKQVEKYFQEHPDATGYSLAMNDSQHFDESPASLARRNGKKNSQGFEDVSDDYYLWANAVVAKVLLQYPDKWFGTLAYLELTDPPKPEIGVNDHIIPFMTQERLRWIDPKLRAIDQTNTEKWAAEAKNLGWYDYIYGMSYCTPREWPHLAQQYLSWGAAHHVRFYTSELYPNWGEGPKGWIFAKLLWNPNQDVDALLDDWYDHAAGSAAAPKLKAYYAIWEKFWTQDILKSKYWTDKGAYLPFENGDVSYLEDVPKSYVEQSDALLDEAYQLADTPERKLRVGKLRDMWRFYYKPSIVIYQSEQAASKQIETEEQALATVPEAIEEVEASHTRQEFFHLLPTYGSDPFYHYIVASSGHLVMDWMDKNWGEGDSLLWNLLPWAQRSAAVRDKLQQLASGADSAVQSNVNIFLAAANGDGKKILENPSFEDGLTGWQITQKTFDFPLGYNFGDAKSPLKDAVQISAENPYSGESSLLISSGHDGVTVLQQALISQDVPYVPGSYYLQAHFYQPKDSPMTHVTQEVQLLDADGKEIKNAPYINTGRRVNLTPGEWTTFLAPIVLPETNVPVAKMRITLAVRALTVVPLGSWRVNQKTYMDDVNLFQLDKSTFKD